MGHMFNICRSKFKIWGSNKFNYMLCRSLISNLCAHCEIWNRHRGTPSTEDGGAAAPSVPRSGCSPRVFSADCCSWLLGMFKTLLGRLQVCSCGTWKPIPTHWQRELAPLLPVPPAPLALLTPKTTGIILAQH